MISNLCFSKFDFLFLLPNSDLLSRKFLVLNAVNLNYIPPVAKITASAASVDLRMIKIGLHILRERSRSDCTFCERGHEF